jgi:hypothetical protein
LSYLRSLQCHAAMEYGNVRSVVALKPGVGDHAAERFADHELGSCYRGLGQIRRRAAIDPGLSGFTALRSSTVDSQSVIRTRAPA